MTYDIFKRTAPAMPTPGKGTKIVGFLLSKASKDMQEVLVPMIMPALSVHLAEVQFQYFDNKYNGMSGQMGHLIGPSGVGNVQFIHLEKVRYSCTLLRPSLNGWACKFSQLEKICFLTGLQNFSNRAATYTP
jgi:hypothetical protein